MSVVQRFANACWGPAAPDHPSRWITFAGIAARVAGAYNALSGIAALSDDDTIAAQAKEVLYGIDLTAWAGPG